MFERNICGERNFSAQEIDVGNMKINGNSMILQCKHD